MTETPICDIMAENQVVYLRQRMEERASMTGQNENHSFIETILTLLKLPEHNNIDIDLLLEQAGTQTLPFTHSQQTQTIYDVIKFMDEMPGGFLIYHADNNEEIIYANKALLRIFKCSSLKEFRDLTGNSFQGLVYHEDLDEVEQSIREQIAVNQYNLDYVEYRIVRKDGAIRWIEDYGHFIHSKSVGDIFYVFLSDATEKRKQHLIEKAEYLNEKILHEQRLLDLKEEYDKERKTINQEHLRRLEVIEGLSVNYESILYVDLDEDRIFPYRLSSRTELQFEKQYQARGFLWYVKDYVNVWVHPEDKERVAEATSLSYIQNKLSKQKTFYINYRVIKDGELQYIQLRIVNVGKKDYISQIVMGYRRVDKEVQREMEQNQLLKEALNDAKLAITAKDTFLSNMSHDIRTPLNAILGFTALAKEHITETETVMHYLEQIETSGNQLLELLQKVLELSWAESSDIPLEQMECNLNDILRDVQNTLQAKISEKNLTFTVDTSGLVHDTVYGDSDKIRRFLQYLANNAVKYNKNGGSVTITAMEHPNRRSRKFSVSEYADYEFTITDTGIGISTDFMPHIFEPFEREKNTTFAGVPGIGLGLTIVKNIVDSMDGTIETSSTAGSGSTFRVSLRLQLPMQSPAFAEDTEQSMLQIDNPKILLVEDNEINLEIETEILHSLGFETETATDGSIAVEKIMHSSPGEYNLVLMDIQMPIMNGRQAARAIRKLDNPELAHIPIIALSANAFESDKRKSLESGMDAHLTKPVDVPQLRETIIKILNSYSSLYASAEEN